VYPKIFLSCWVQAGSGGGRSAELEKKLARANQKEGATFPSENVFPSDVLPHSGPRRLLGHSLVSSGINSVRAAGYRVSSWGGKYCHTVIEFFKYLLQDYIVTPSFAV
jgi:hypothetical protein